MKCFIKSENKTLKRTIQNEREEMMKSMVKMDEKQKQEMNQLNTKMDRLESTMETILNVIKKDW